MITMESDDPTATRTLIKLLILSLFLLTTITPTTAVTITDEYIQGTAIASGYGEGYWTDFSFMNYCPLCDGYGTLEWNPKGTREGEITCLYGCDADYSVSGKDKYYKGCRGCLTPYSQGITEPAPAPERVNQTEIIRLKLIDYLKNN